MKRFIIRSTTILLVLFCLIPLAACNGSGDKATAAATEKHTDPSTEPETDPTGEDSRIPHNNRTDSSVCFIGTNEEDSKSVFYDSLQEAIDANPNGADIGLCADQSLDPMPVMPEGSDYSITFNWYNVTWENKCGFVFEISRDVYLDFVYYTSLDALFEAQENNLDRSYIWIFSETDEYKPAKYYITANDNGFDVNYDCDLENWGRPYVVECQGRFYYDLQDAINNAAGTSLILRMDIVSDFIRKDTITVPWNSFCYRVVGNWHKMDCTFDRGASFDTDYDTELEWLCYYSDIDMLTKAPIDSKTHWVWIWTDMEGYKPGKYTVSPPSGLPDGEPDENGLVSYFTLNRYTLEWIAGIDTFRKDLYESEYDDYYPDGE